MKFIKKFVRDTKAATAIEYGLIAALIAVAGISAMGLVGNSVGNTFNGVSTELDTANEKLPQVSAIRDSGIDRCRNRKGRWAIQIGRASCRERVVQYV